MAGFAPDAGTSLGSIFIKRAGDARALFAPVEIFAGDAVGHLAKRASLERGWNVDAAYVELFLVPAESEDSLAAGEVGSEELILATRPLSSIKALSAVGILNRSCLLARLTGPSAAAPSECVREATGPFGLTRRACHGIPLGLGAPPPSSRLPLHPIAGDGGGNNAGAGA